MITVRTADLHDAVLEGLRGDEAIEVFEEVADENEVFVLLAAGGVGGDEAVGGGPEGVVAREGLGHGDIEISGGEAVGFEGGAQRVGVDGGAAADVVEDGRSLHQMK